MVTTHSVVMAAFITAVAVSAAYGYQELGLAVRDSVVSDDATTCRGARYCSTTEAAAQMSATPAPSSRCEQWGMFVTRAKCRSVCAPNKSGCYQHPTGCWTIPQGLHCQAACDPFGPPNCTVK
jgi:hypothetical protein